MDNRTRNKQTVRSYFVLSIFVLFLIGFPNIAGAGPFDWILDIYNWVTGIKDSLEALKNLILNFGLFVALLFSGILPVLVVATTIALLLMNVLAALADGVFAIMKELINQTLNITVVPGPNTVEVVRQGWQISRDIASLFFIVILAFIGLATILNLQTYQVRKTLPALLLMAVLLNFSGLVVGFVVDMANLLSYSFIAATHTDSLAFIKDSLNTTINLLTQTALKVKDNLTTADPITFFRDLFVYPLISAGAQVIFYFFYMLALLAIVFLLIFRIGILWLLTIFAPLAFASYVLPATRQFWRQWWQALLQWALMIVPMSFFLYLATLIAGIRETIRTQFSAGVPYTDPTITVGVVPPAGWFSGLLISFIAPLLILLTLFVGFMISITFVPAASRGLVMRGGKFITGTATAGALAGGAALGKRLAPGLEKFGERVRGPRKTEEEIAAMTARERFGWRLRRGVGAVGVPGEMIAKEITGAIKKKEEADVERMAAQFKKLSGEQILNRFKVNPGTAAKAAALRALSETNPELFKASLKNAQIKESDVVRAGKLLWDRGHKEFAARYPTDAMAAVIDPVNWQAGLKDIENGKAFLPPIINEYNELKDKLKTAVDPAEIAALQARMTTLRPQVVSAVQAMGPTERAELKRGKDLIRQGQKKKREVMQNLTSVIKDPTQVSADALKSSAFMGAVVDTWTGDKIGRMATHFGKVAADALQKEIDRKGSGLLKDNGRLGLWLTGPAATNAGLTLPEALKNMGPQKMKDMLREVRLDMEKTLQNKTVALINNFRGREELLFRDYHRSGTTEEMKKAIEGAVRALGRTMPGKEAVNSRIVKQEKLISDFQQEEIKTITARRKVQRTYRALGSPTTGPVFNRWQTQMNEINRRLTQIAHGIRAAETKEVSSLKKI